MHNIILIGDSLTEYSFNDNGWGPQMSKWYNGKATVLNRGYAGYTSTMIANMMPRITANLHNILFCTILLGTNDCYSTSGFVNLDDYKKNIIRIINHMRNLNPNIIIFLVTPPVSRINDNVLNYANKIREIYNEEKNIELIDLHTPNGIVKTDLCDLVHFNKNANTKLFIKIHEKINTKHRFLAPEKL